MQFVITQPVAALFPNLVIGILRGTVSEPKAQFDQTLRSFRQRAEQSLLGRGIATDELSDFPTITAWREAYRAFGAKPKKHRPTHEALARRILRSEGWPNINPLVDVYLSNQVEHLLPHGGYDSTQLRGTVRLTVSDGGESFVAIGGETETTDAGEVLYRDDERVLTRRWNYRDADATKIMPETSRFILMVESPTAEFSAALTTAMASLRAKYEEAFEGSFSTQIVELNGAETSVAIE